MMRVTDDLLSTVSTISSAFTEFGGDGDEDDEVEPPEMKFDPLVKTEIPEDLGNVTEEDIDDEFIKRYLGDGSDLPGRQEEREETGGSKRGQLPVGTARRGRGGARGRGRGGAMGNVIISSAEEQSEGGIGRRRESRKTEKFFAEVESSLDDAFPIGGGGGDDGDNFKDEDWSPDEDDDWAPGKTKKRKSVTKRNVSRRGRGGRKSTVSGEGSKPKRQYKKREKVETVEDFMDMQFEQEGEIDVNGETPGGGRRKKRISEMTPEEQERMRALWREAHLKKIVKAGRREEVKSEVPDESDASSTRTPKKRNKKRIGDMTPEEQEKVRSRWREQHKKQRARDRELREAFKSEVTEESDASSTRSPKKRNTSLISDLNKKQHAQDKELKSEATEESDGSSIKSPGRRKKRIAEMTPEEREAIQARWRIQHERRRARRQNMSAEKIEAEKAKARERQRLRRAMAKEGALPEEQLKSIEEQYRKDRERKRARRAAMTPEEKKEEIQKTTMYRLLREARMTEEEKRARQMKMYLARMAKLAEMDPKERDAMEEKTKARRREAGRRRYEKLKSTLGQDGIRAMRRNYWHGMSPEQKAKALAKLRECHRRKVEKLKQDPEKWEEVKQKWKERDRIYKQRRRETEGVSRRRRRSTAPQGGIRKGPTKKWSELTEEEKEKRRQSRREYVLKRKLAIQKLLDSGMSMEEIQQQTETPEQRERRLIRQRIRKARSNLRSRLQSVGATPEEIQQKVEELKHTYQPTHAFRPYKPRPENWRPVDPTEIAKLEAEGKLENLGEIKPLTKSPKTSPEPILPKPKASTSKLSKQPPTPRKRGRPLKYPLPQQSAPPPPLPVSISTTSSNNVIIFKDEKAIPLIPAESTTSTIQIQSYQPVTSDPQQQQSTIVSISTVNYPQQQVHYPPQHQYETPSTYHQQPSQPIFHYPAQPPPPTQQQQSYSLQNILDGIVFHEVASGDAAVSAVDTQSQHSHHTSSYQYDHSTTSSQHEYGSSYYEDDNHSPAPTSPGGAGGNFDDSFSDISYTQQPPQETNYPTTDCAADASKKSKKPRGPRPYVYRPPKNPNAKTRTKRADVIRDVVCDECGQPYNRLSLRAHKNQLHNPNYDVKNRTCLICGEKYKHAQRWYTHYLRDHVRPNQVPSHKSHMCEECGQSFVNKENYKKHQYYIHGDGLKKENHIRCPVCPEEKLFKEKMGYYSHLKRFHPTYVRPGHDCYRCDKSFPNDKVLGEHVGAAHPESFFPCPYCTATRFTQLGLYFHYSRCTKITKEERNELKGRCEGVFCLEEMPINCELCEKTVILSSLTRHYKEMHNVKEDKFTCPECRKEFKTRGFWAIHMEEKHQRSVEEMKEILRKLNASDRQGISITPQRSRYSRPALGKGVVGRKKSGGGRGRRGRPSLKNNGSSEDEDVEEEEEEGSDGEWDPEESGDDDGRKKSDKAKRKRKRRKVVVIAEEDELESQIMREVQL